MDEEETPTTEPRGMTPFKVIKRGEDTLNIDDEVVFADFSPRPVPSDVMDPAPKASSAPAPVDSSGSPESTSGAPAPESPSPKKENAPAAATGDGRAKASGTSSQTSS